MSSKVNKGELKITQFLLEASESLLQNVEYAQNLDVNLRGDLKRSADI